MSDAIELSVVIPVFNEEENILPMYERLRAALDDLVKGLEIIYVDDGSRDRSWVAIEELATKDPRVRGISFARNFGHQAAVTAGVDHARGEAVVLIDADLQDPPEVIPELIARWREGYDVVYAQRKKRQGESLFKKLTAALFYRLLHRITDVSIPVDTGDFRLMGPRALAAFRALPERNRFIRGMVSWIGFRQVAVPYERHARAAGETKYPFRKMLRFALDAITSFSFLPLRLSTFLGLGVSVFSFLYIIVVLILKFMGISWPGYTSLMASILFLGGVQLVMIGMLGEYLARVFDEVKRRPLYLVGNSTSKEMGVLPPGRD